MAKIITMASAKGGSGKTVLTATFAAFLSSLNKKVLMIDADAATNGLTLMYLQEVRIQNDYAYSGKRNAGGTFQLGSDDIFSIEIVTLKNNVDLLPATYQYVNTENIDVKNYKIGLISYLKIATHSYDYIFLDAQAGSDHFAETAISRSVSDEVIIVSEYDPLSAAGVERLKGFFREDLTYDRTWVLLNKMLPDFVQSFSDFLEVSKYLSPIPWDADVVRAYAKRKLAIDVETGNEYTIAIIQTLKGLLGELIIPDIEIWMNNKSTSIREPVINQYKETESQLEELMHLELKIEQNRNRTKAKNRAIILLTVGGLFPILTAFLAREFDFIHIDISYEIIIAVALFPSTVMLFWDKLQSSNIFKKNEKNEFEQLKIRREISFLEEKLKKLQVLRDSDSETLIKLKKII